MKRVSIYRRLILSLTLFYVFVKAFGAPITVIRQPDPDADAVPTATAVPVPLPVPVTSPAPVIEFPNGTPTGTGPGAPGTGDQSNGNQGNGVPPGSAPTSQQSPAPGGEDIVTTPVTTPVPAITQVPVVPLPLPVPGTQDGSPSPAPQAPPPSPGVPPVGPQGEDDFSPEESPTESPEDDDDDNTVAIVLGSVFGGLALLALLAGLAYVLFGRGKSGGAEAAAAAAGPGPDVGGAPVAAAPAAEIPPPVVEPTEATTVTAVEGADGVERAIATSAAAGADGAEGVGKAVAVGAGAAGAAGAAALLAAKRGKDGDAAAGVPPGGRVSPGPDYLIGAGPIPSKDAYQDIRTRFDKSGEAPPYATVLGEGETPRDMSSSYPLEGEDVTYVSDTPTSGPRAGAPAAGGATAYVSDVYPGSQPEAGFTTTERGVGGTSGGFEYSGEGPRTVYTDTPGATATTYNGGGLGEGAASRGLEGGLAGEGARTGYYDSTGVEASSGKISEATPTSTDIQIGEEAAATPSTDYGMVGETPRDYEL